MVLLHSTQSAGEPDPWGHVRVGKACWELGRKLPEEWPWVIDWVKVIMEDLPPDGSRQLLELYKQVPGNRKYAQAYTALDDLRHLLIRVSESWERYSAFFSDSEMPGPIIPQSR